MKKRTKTRGKRLEKKEEKKKNFTQLEKGGRSK